MVKVILGEEWENHRVGTTVEVDRSRGSWLLSKGGRAANAESAHALGVVWDEPKPERKPAAKKSAQAKKAPKPAAAVAAEKQLDPEKE